ncbi:MAG TPA: recombination-associated protein RdgC [Rhizobacter sp.]|nr:recombination-associated protein RdgC [Rhizobacter sp.]
MFKNALLYRIGPWEPPSSAEIERRLDAGRFVECGASQPESAGWVEPRGEKNAALMEGVGGQLILKLCVERKAVPSQVVKTQLEAQLDKVEADTGRRPKGKKAKELKEDIVNGLLPRAFPKRSTTLVWIDPRARLVLVGAGSVKASDRIVSMLVDLLGGGITLTLLQTELSPATAMAEWLKTREAPAGFSIDRECELKQPDSEKSTVRYARHTLDIDEVGEHITQGKLPTSLAMTWNGRVSFVLNEAGAIKKIKLLDVALEGAGSTAGKDDNGFDADVAITTGELGQLIPQLIDALGGELARDKPPVQQAA